MGFINYLNCADAKIYIHLFSFFLSLPHNILLLSRTDSEYHCFIRSSTNLLCAHPNPWISLL